MKENSVVALVVSIALTVGLDKCFISSSLRTAEGGGGFRVLDKEEIEANERMLDVQLKSAKSITVYEIHAFHTRFIERCMIDLDEKIELEYRGTLRELGPHRGGQRIEGPRDFLDSISWDVFKDGVLFRFWISLEKQADTVADCKIGDRIIYVNVEFVNRLRTVEEKLPELGNRSVKELLQRLRT